MYYSALDATTKFHGLGWLKQQKLIFSQFGRLDIQEQGAVRVGFW